MLPPKLIMSPIDFSEHSDQALKTATELAVCFHSQPLLVNIVPAIPKLPSPEVLFSERQYEDALHQDAVKRLDGIAPTAAEQGVVARSELGTANDVSGELLRIAEHKAVDLIVIATHGMSGWYKLAFGTVAEKVVRLALCPVLLLRVQHADVESSDTTGGAEGKLKGEAKAASHKSLEPGSLIPSAARPRS